MSEGGSERNRRDYRWVQIDIKPSDDGFELKVQGRGEELPFFTKLECDEHTRIFYSAESDGAIDEEEYYLKPVETADTENTDQEADRDV